jgi:hypothetical protein
LDGIFSTVSFLPSIFSGSFVAVTRSALRVGHVIAELSCGEPILYRVSRILPDVVLQSLHDQAVYGRLITTRQVWVATAEGLSLIKERLAQMTTEVTIPADPPVIHDLSGAPAHPASLLELFRAASSQPVVPVTNLCLPSRNPPLAPVALTPGLLSPQIAGATSSTLEGFNALRQERFEASRGFRTLLGHDLLRFSNVTNNTGNCSDDRAFNNVIVDIHQDDRLLPALSRQQLKFLLTLQFSLAYEANKPTGIHIQAFRPKGSAFQYVVQVHDAVHKLARVLDNIRNPKGSRFFTSLFSPLLDLLSPSNHSGLAMLPVAYVVEAVSQTLLEFGCQANVPDADNWTTEVKQISGLSPCLKMDITHHLQVASLKALKQSESERSRLRPASGGGGRQQGTYTQTGRGRGRGTVHQQLRHASVARVQSGTSQSSAQSDSFSPQARGLCISALFEKYALGTGCRKVGSGTCPFNHNVASATKEEERVAAGLVGKEDKKRQLLAAIG